MNPKAALRLYFFFAFGALGLYLPFFPSWLAARGFRGSEMSAVVSLMPLLALASPAVVGMLADRFAVRGRIVTVAAAGTALGVSLLGLAASLLAPVPLVVVIACMAVFAAFRSPTTALADVLALESGGNYGRYRLFGSLGFLTWAIVGGQIVDVEHPFQLPLLIAGALWLVVVVSRLLPRASALPPRRPFGDARALFGQPGYRWLLATTVAIFLAMSSYDLCASLRLRELGASGTYIGFFWAIATGSEVLLLYFAAPFVARVGPGKLLTLSCLVSSARWYFLSEASSLEWVLAMQPLHAIAFGLMWVSVMATLRREVGDRGMATGQGLHTTALAVGSALGIWVWGITYESVGSRAVFRGAALCALVAALLASRLIRWGVPATVPRDR